MTCLWIDIPWTPGFKLFSVGHCGSLAFESWSWHGGMDVPYGLLCTCTHVCTLNLWIHVNSNISKSKCCKIWQIRSCTTTVGNSVSLIWLLLVPACIPILYHIPSPLEGWVSPTACPSRVVKTSPMAVLAALPSTCWKDQYNWTSKVCQWYYWWFRNPGSPPPGIYIYIHIIKPYK